MSGLCACFGRESEPPTPLDAEIVVQGNCDIGLAGDKQRTKRLLAYPRFGALRPNFDFVTHDNGETYIATFRAMHRGKVMGHDSNPIPKAIFNEFRVIQKRKRGDMYVILLDTNGHNLDPIVDNLTKEDYEKLEVHGPPNSI